MSDIRIATAEDQILLEKEAKYCSYGDTVHYIEPPRIFNRCEGSYVWDTSDQAYLDLQMWYSAVNFGYANPRLNNALKQQIDTLPQIASQYLHKGKIELSEMIAVDAKKKFGLDGRVHFNVGGSQSIEDSLKVVRNASNGKSLMFAFEGGYHGRTLGASSHHLQLPLSPPLRPLRRARATSFRSRTTFRRPERHDQAEEYGSLPACSNSPACSRPNTTASGTRKSNQSEYAAFYVEPIQGTGGYVDARQ
jgi:4-aminobutyrate aminotransferase/(S)-3-amino-2-methylpropionate transaminase